MTTPQFHRRDVFTAGGSTIKGVNRVDWPEPLVNLAERKVEGGVGLSIINSIDPGTVVITTEGPVTQLEAKNGQDITLTLTRSFVKTTDSGVAGCPGRAESRPTPARASSGCPTPRART